MNNPRAISALIITQLLQSNGSLSTHLTVYRDHRDYQLIQEMCFGTCRWFHLLNAITDYLLAKPLRNKDRDVLSLLLIGLYQIREMRIPNHAAINETVDGANELGKSWAKSLINGVLRNYIRQSESIDESFSGNGQVLYAHPPWLFDLIGEAWPEAATQIFKGNNQRPPFTIRVNKTKTSRENYLKTLHDAGINAVTGQLADTSIILEKPMAARELPGFDSGLVSVQDEASQLVAPLLILEPDLRILDACAAPGGKTCHILECEQVLTSVVAIDNSESRLARVQENLDRLSQHAELLVADARDLESWWDGLLFDRILLDAPCSATGVIRRHPDIKLLRKASDINKLSRQQLDLLRSLWKCLKPGGLLLYTSCSVLPAENSELIAQFLDATSDAKYEGITADWGVECSNGRQLLPDAASGPDGFFYSLLRKL